MIWTSDPVADAERYMTEQDKWLEKRPVCSYCGEHIQDDFYYDINDEILCHDCLEAYFRKEID